MSFVNCRESHGTSKQVEIWSILKPLRYIPRFLGLTPYCFTNDAIDFSKFGYLYASFYVILYVAPYCVMMSVDTTIFLTIPVLYWPQLLSTISCFCGCIVGIIRNGFQQNHMIEFVEILHEFDEKIEYSVSKIGRRDATRLSFIAWITPCLALTYCAIESLALISFDEKIHLSAVLPIFYSTSFLAELTTFLIYALLLGVRLRYLNEQIEIKMSAEETRDPSSIDPENLRSMYSALLKAADLFNEHYNLQFLFWLFHLSMFTICRLFVILCINDSTIHLLINILTLGIYLTTATFFMAAAQFVGNQANRTPIILLRRNIVNLCDFVETRREYLQLSLCMTLESYSINAMGFFDVDIGICNTIFVLGVMCVPILVTISQNH